MSLDEQTDKENVVYTYSGILFAFKKKEFLPFATIWMNLENIMVNEISQIQVDKYYVIPLI